MSTNFVITLAEDLELQVFGDYRKGEPDVGLPPYFEVGSIVQSTGTIFDLIEWTEAQDGYALIRINELCLEKAANL